MKAITIHTLQAMLSMMFLSGILLSAEPPSKNNVLPPGTQGAPRRPNSRFTGDPPPTKKIVWGPQNWDEMSNCFIGVVLDMQIRPETVFVRSGPSLLPRGHSGPTLEAAKRSE